MVEESVSDPWPSRPDACLPSARQMTRLVTGSLESLRPPHRGRVSPTLSFRVLYTQAAVHSLCKRQISAKPQLGLLPWKHSGRGGFSLNMPLVWPLLHNRRVSSWFLFACVWASQLQPEYLFSASHLPSLPPPPLMCQRLWTTSESLIHLGCLTSSLLYSVVVCVPALG